MKVIDTANNMPLSKMKDEIEANVGNKIFIKEFNKQKKLLRQYSGNILQTYNNLFIVKVINERFSLNKSFSYVDFSTGELTYELEH